MNKKTATAANRKQLTRKVALRFGLAGYHISLAGKPAPAAVDGFSPEQRFFLAFAQVWRGKIRPEALKKKIQEDVHPWGEFRVNGAPSTCQSSTKPSTSGRRQTLPRPRAAPGHLVESPTIRRRESAPAPPLADAAAAR